MRVLLRCLLVAVFAAALLWRPAVEVGIEPSQIKANGSAYEVDMSGIGYWGYRLLGDTDRFQLQSSLLLMRDGVPLGPSHTNPVTLPAGINGNGAYSHWSGRLIFSTIGNVDPRSDGHTYSIRAQLSLDERLAACIGSIFVALFGVLVFRHASLIGAVWKVGSTPAKVAALLFCASFFPDVPGEARSIAASSGFPLLALYLIVFSVGVAGLIITPFLSDWRLRLPAAIILVAGFAADRAIYNLFRHGLVFDLMQVLWRERSLGRDVFAAYQNELLSNVAIAAPLLVAFAMPPADRWRASSRMAAFPIAAIVSIGLVIAATKGRVQAFPPPFAVPADLVLAQMRLFTPNDEQPRRPVAYNGELHPRVRKIVMVVDESVRGDFLGINNRNYDNTPFLRDNESRIANYGEAVSSANCSGSSRMILRSGLQKSQVPDLANRRLAAPMIWAYAHKAGFKTAMVDAWHQERPAHSEMTPLEEKQIDVQVYPSDQPRYLRDGVVAEKVMQLLQGDEPILIYVNKFGTHMDYNHSFPASLPYAPAETASRSTLDPRRHEMIRAYHKAIKFSVDDFFAKLLPSVLSDPDAILIYTSDHGQSMFEGGYDASHCSYNPAVVHREFSVPLFVATGSSQLAPMFMEAAKHAHDRAHHFDIFPTLLEMMGYPQEWTSANYAPSLLNVKSDRERYGLLGSLNAPGAKWIKIELN